MVGLGGGAVTGLDYAAVLPVVRALREEWQAAGDPLLAGMTDMDLMEDVQVIETAILDLQRERRAAERGQQA